MHKTPPPSSIRLSLPAPRDQLGEVATARRRPAERLELLHKADAAEAGHIDASPKHSRRYLRVERVVSLYVDVFGEKKTSRSQTSYSESSLLRQFGLT